MMILKEIKTTGNGPACRCKGQVESLQGMSYSFNRLDFSLNMKV